MSFTGTVSPLRIANEAFLVAATIERCPRTMMLRELVMNALEAARSATVASKDVLVTALPVDGVSKLCIWNTGRGLLAHELLQVSDLSSSLFKTVSLDGNFGMGAKAASLTSNRHGLRYRSCRLGRVSQILLGQRDGVYGRVLQPDGPNGVPAEVVDVTEQCRVEALYDLGHDWTEVLLLGNSPEQDTVRDPYAGDPVVAADWVMQTLARRFLRIFPDVVLRLAPKVCGGFAGGHFESPFNPVYFDRVEQVTLPGNIVIHYCYRNPDSDLQRHSVPVVGLGAVAYDNEIYALVDGQRWALEAPSYGFSFAAKHCTVVVELGEGFGARPEQYRQFLRFRDGDQHQVQFADFGSLVRANIPDWLRRIIESMMPQSDDYLQEIKADLQQLLLELDIKDQPAALPKPATPQAAVLPEEAAAQDPPRPAPSPPKPALPTAPDIIIVSDEAQIVEKALGGRAARFYPATRQIFINTRYSAFAKLAAQLRDQFAAAADLATVEQIARQAAEWALIRRLTRTLVHSLGKKTIGWQDEEVRAVQTPESMSLVVDDLDTVHAAANRRMATQLGLEWDMPGSIASSLGGRAGQAAAELAEAEARLQRALAANIARVGPYYRQIALILRRQQNMAAARAWLDRGIALDPEDPWCRYELAGLHIAHGDLRAAAEAADAALARASGNLEPFLRRRADVEQRSGNIAVADNLLQQAAAVDPSSPWAYFDLAGLKLATGDLEGAAVAADAAMARSQVPSALLLRRRAEIAARGGDLALARRLLTDAIVLDPTDPWSSLDLSAQLLSAGDTDGAVQVIDEALSSNPTSPAHLLRRRSEIEAQRGNRTAALAAAIRACEADPDDPWCRYQLSNLLFSFGDLDGSEEAIIAAIERTPNPSPHFLRRRGEIEGRRKNHDAAQKWLEQAMTVDPTDPWSRLELSSQLLAQGDLRAADKMAANAQHVNKGNPVHFLRRRSEIAARAGDWEAAGVWLNQAIAADANDPWSRLELSTQLMAQNDLDGAMTAAEAAVELSHPARVVLLRRCGEIEQRRNHRAAARAWFDRAIATDPSDPQPWLDISNLLLAEGDLEGARQAAEQSVRLGSPV